MSGPEDGEERLLGNRREPSMFKNPLPSLSIREPGHGRSQPLRQALNPGLIR